MSKIKKPLGVIVVMSEPELDNMAFCARVKKEIQTEISSFPKGTLVGIVTGDEPGPERWADELAVVNSTGNIQFLRVFAADTGLCHTWKRSILSESGFRGDPPTEDRWFSPDLVKSSPWIGSKVGLPDHSRHGAMLFRCLVFPQVRALLFHNNEKNFKSRWVGSSASHVWPFPIRGVALPSPR